MIVQEYSDTERGQLVVNRRYDGRGLLTSESAPRKERCLLGSFAERDRRNNRGFKSTRTYDTLRRPALATLPDGETTEHRYDAGPARWSIRTTTSSAGQRRPGPHDQGLRGTLAQIRA